MFRLSHRRGVRGYLAISRGLIAVGAGDASATKRAANEAERIAPGEPLALLLSAQAAQLAGDRAAGRARLSHHDGTPVRPICSACAVFISRRSGGRTKRRRAPMPKKRQRRAPALGWAGQATFEFRCATGDWAAALSALEPNSRYGLIDRTKSNDATVPCC